LKTLGCASIAPKISLRLNPGAGVFSFSPASLSSEGSVIDGLCTIINAGGRLIIKNYLDLMFRMYDKDFVILISMTAVKQPLLLAGSRVCTEQIHGAPVVRAVAC
jgi:hypothetical protein